MSVSRCRDLFASLFAKPRSGRSAAAARRKPRDVSRGVERLEPRQVMAGMTIGDSLLETGGLVPPAAITAGGQAVVASLPSPSTAETGSGQPVLLVTPPSSPPPSGGGSGSQPPGSPTGGADYTILTNIWGTGKNAPMIFENDDFIVSVSFAQSAVNVPPRPVTVGIWADINFNDRPDPGESYTTTTVAPQGFVRAQFKSIDDGPWPGNGTRLDAIPVVVTVSDRGTTRQVETGATVYNVAPMLAEPPEYTLGVDESGRDFVRVATTFWDPGNKDFFKVRLQTGAYDQTTDWLVPWDDGDDVKKSIFYTFFIKSGDLGDVFTLTISDDDSGADTRWNQVQTVGLNNNDDNGNDLDDRGDRSLTRADPDVVKLGGLREVRAWLPDQMLDRQGELVLFYDPSVVKLWDSPKKERLFSPYQGLQGEVGQRFTGTETLYVEGVGHGTTEIYATWTPNRPGFFVNEKMNRMVSHAFTVSVAGIDVDIDSDNDEGVDPNFERDEWNEYLEGSPYALGKLVGRNAGKALQPSDGFVPFVVDLVGLSPLNSYMLVFTWTDKRFQVWRRDQSVHRSDEIENGVAYDLRRFQAPFSQSGTFTFWISQFYHADRIKAVDVLPPQNAIKVTLESPGTGFETRDGVLIRPVWHPNAELFAEDQNGEYPPALQKDPAVRSAGASQAVYRDASDVNFALKKLEAPELRKLLAADPFFDVKNRNDPLAGHGTRAEALGYIVDNLTSDAGAFRARVYLDHCDTASTKAPKDGGGRYIITFQGTNPTSPEDWVTNLGQFLEGFSSQYEIALRIGDIVRNVSFFRWDMAGHSLGGGLAAAATLNSNGKGITFNAAGINPAIFEIPGGRGRLHEYVRFGKANYDNNRQAMIRAYVVERYATPGDPSGTVDCPDFLTWAQGLVKRVTGYGWTADGTVIVMEGVLNLTPTESQVLDQFEQKFAEEWSRRGELEGVGRIQAAFRAAWPELVLAGYSIANAMVESHDFPSILYGLLHDDRKGWNAYDQLDPRWR